MIFWYDSTLFEEIGAYLKLSIGGMLFFCLEWWAAEILAFFAGYLGVISLATYTV